MRLAAKIRHQLTSTAHFLKSVLTNQARGEGAATVSTAHEIFLVWFPELLRFSITGITSMRLLEEGFLEY